MDMEGLGTEEFVGSSSNNVNDATHMIVKGKRTKRLRLLSPCGVSAAAAAAAVMTSSSSSANSGDQVSGGGGGDYGSFSSTTTTTTYESTDQEEEDMANCLILLAQGGGGGGGDAHRHKKQAEDHDDHDLVHDGGNTSKIEKGNGNTSSSRRFAEMATATATAARIGFYVYECKTCNRTFPSFQALGGHRASHKKPKMMAVEEKKPPLIPASLQPPPPPPPQQPQLMTTNYDPFEEEAGQAHIKSGPAISLQLGSSHRAFHGNNKAKIHECSICGSEFTSGQALGGHMRRHRASSTNTASTHHQLMAMGGINETSCNTTAMATAAAAAKEELEEVQPRRNILQLDLNLPAPEDDPRESKFQFTTATQKSMVLSAAPALVDCHY